MTLIYFIQPFGIDVISFFSNYTRTGNFDNEVIKKHNNKVIHKTTANTQKTTTNYLRNERERERVLF